METRRDISSFQFKQTLTQGIKISKPLLNSQLLEAGCMIILIRCPKQFAEFLAEIRSCNVENSSFLHSLNKVHS